MENTSFDDIRAYYDDEIPVAMQRIADDPLLEPAAGFAFPGMDIEAVRAAIRACRTTDQIQREIMYPAIKRIIDTTIAEFTASGIENVSPDDGQLFISNHRDIVLDAFMLQFALFTRSLPTTDIALGDQSAATATRSRHLPRQPHGEGNRKDDVRRASFSKIRGI